MMSDFIKSQSEVKANLVHQIRSIIDAAEAEKRGLTAEENQTIDRIESAIEDAQRSIAVAERTEVRRAEAEQAAGSFVPQILESRSEADIFRALASGELRSFEFEKRATLVNSSDTVPVSFYDRLWMIARKVGPFLNVADVIVRSSANDLRLPVMTAYSTAAVTTAGSAISQSEPTFSSILLSPTKGAFLALIANELITDAGFDIVNEIATQAGNAIGTWANATATSTVVAAAGSGVASGSAVLTSDSLIDLQYSVDGGYRPNGAYMMSTKSLGLVRKLKDNVGAYLYQVGTGGAGAPDTFAGVPVLENPAMAEVASGAKSVIFGDFSSVAITHNNVQVATSADAYFNQDVTAYRTTLRLASGLKSSGAVKYLTTA
jgi:HK97 family phage major capsid protein